MGAMTSVDREKWRARLPRRCEEVVFAVLNVVCAEACVKRRRGDSVAVLSKSAGCCLYVRNNNRQRKQSIPNTSGGVLELAALSVGM